MEDIIRAHVIIAESLYNLIMAIRGRYVILVIQSLIGGVLSSTFPSSPCEDESYDGAEDGEDDKTPREPFDDGELVTIECSIGGLDTVVTAFEGGGESAD